MSEQAKAVDGGELVEWLRSNAERMEAGHYDPQYFYSTTEREAFHAAADRITALTAENERLREALRNVTQEGEHLEGRMATFRQANRQTIDAWKMRLCEARAALQAPNEEGV